MFLARAIDTLENNRYPHFFSSEIQLELAC